MKERKVLKDSGETDMTLPDIERTETGCGAAN
jgi:hypothetical protein